MCSISGLPTPGSEVPVLITRIKLNPNCGFVELWVNIVDGRKHMRDDIQISTKKFCGSEGKPGDLCLVCVSDIWHRARILSIQSEIYNVFLIDQKQPHVTTSEALAWDKCDSFLLPPETESCILANVLSIENNWPESTTNFLKSLSGKKFKGLVQHVLMPDRIILLDIPIVSKQICMCGVAKKIPVDEFKCFVLKCLHLPKEKYPDAYHIMQEHSLSVNGLLEKHDQYFYPELFTDTLETVNVTEVINPQKIFCKLLIFSKAVKLLSEQIHQHYEESSDLGEVQPQTCGDPCAARGINGRWHRSLLKQNMTSDGAIEVLHVDEGKTELVPAGNIKPLHGKFLRMPVFTYPCSLDDAIDNGTEWTTDQTDYFKLLLLHQTVVVRFVHYNIPKDVYYVTLDTASAPYINNCAEMAGLFPPSKTEQDSNVQNEPIPSPVLSSVGDKQHMDVQNNVIGINVDSLQEESLASTKNLAVNGRTDDVPTSSSDEIHIKDGPEDPNPLAQSNGHCSTGLPSLLQNVCDEDVFTVGSTVDVNISCIESLQKFWCQTTENADSLRLLMQDLQNYYAPAHPQSLVESVCVARNPNNGMWYRAMIIANHHSPVVDVRFIDYGQIQKVSLRDVRPIDPVFLRLNAQAFQCCLFNLENRTNPTAIGWTDAALEEFQRFVDLHSSSNIELKCTVKAVMSDEEGLRINMVDIVTPSDSACKLLGQRCAQDKSYAHIPLQVPSDSYSYSTHNIEVGGKEKVWVTSSENVNHFYCQLERNSHLFEKVMENVHKHIGQPQCTVHSLGLNSICLARYSDNQWYRAEVVEMSPRLTVTFVDYGHTLEVNQSDICPFPTEASIARSVPLLAIPLGLFDVPEQVPQEVNQWFADHTINCSLTISVVAKGAKGKLFVELFDGSVNVNAKVRERISQMTQQKMTSLAQQTDKQLSKHASVPNEDRLTQENMPVLMKLTENNVHTRNGICDRAEHKMSSQSINDVSAPEIKHDEALNEGRKPTSDVTLEDRKTMSAEMFIEGGDRTQLSLPSCLEGNLKICIYKKPNISFNKTEEVYASCIVGPYYFWCQYANTEELNEVSRLAQEAGQAQQDIMFTKTLGPRSPCLALFSSDNQWYRAQVIHNTENTLNVVFIDYGNESDVDIKDVRPLPQCLLEKAPQAFLCSLIGFDESKGSWDDNVHDDFNNLLVDKPLRVIVFNMEDHPVIAVPQYAVQLECDNMVVNDAVLKYWKPVATEHALRENPQTENLLHGGEIDYNMTHLNVSKGSVTTNMYKNPNISKNKKEEVYASCIVEPHFFWCQYANTEELNKVWRLAQEAGQTQQDAMFPEALGPGSPCLALFSSDKQWYRAQVIHRAGNAFHVVFIDYGNECDVDIKDVRSVPPSLLEKAPQAFLCSLSGFFESRGSWVDEVYEDFHNLLVDKPLKLTVFNMADHSEIAVPQYAVEIECEGVVVNAAMQKYWKPVAKEHVSIDSPQTETVLQDGQTEFNMTHLSVSEGNIDTGMYTEPKISKSKTEMVYASCIVEPHFFWCQYANTEELNQVSRLAQEAGQAQQDIMFPETLGAGSPCLALFSSDKQWYRAQVIHKADNAFHVVFIDYGNESDVDIKDVRPLPPSLLEKAPQAFLCSLSGFFESRGSWVDEVYEDFYNLLVGKPLKLTVFNMEDHSEIAVPQYAVQIECEGVVVNTLMEKYWKGLDTDHALAESVASALDPDKCPCENPAVTEQSRLP